MSGQTAAGKQGTRLPRSRRSPTPPQFLLTPRDIRILRHVYSMRFLTQDQIGRLEFSPSSVSSCKRRLTLLYHGGYLDRVFVPVGAVCGFGRGAYCLDSKGAALLAREDGLTPAELDWRQDDNDRDSVFLDHLLDTNDVQLAMIASTRRRRWGLRWTNERTLRRDLAKEKIGDPLDPGRLLSLIPDGYARIEAAGEAHAFAVELDRGTVEEKRIRQKIRAYGEWNASGAHRRRYGVDSLRVLFVVSGRPSRPARARRLREWCEAEGGRSLFWFMEHDHLAAADILSDPIWEVAGRPGRHALIETRPPPPRPRSLPALR